MRPIREVIAEIIESIKAGKVGAYDEDEGSCAYEDSEGMRCAIGCLLPESTIQLLKDEGLNTESDYMRIVSKFPDIEDQIGVPVHDGTLLQHVHDWCFVGRLRPQDLLPRFEALRAGEWVDLHISYSRLTQGQPFKNSSFEVRPLPDARGLGAPAQICLKDAI